MKGAVASNGIIQHVVVLCGSSCRCDDLEASIFEETRGRSGPWGERKALALCALASRKTITSCFQLLWVKAFVFL